LTPLYFAPLRDSGGKRYLIQISASGGTPRDSVVVFGSQHDEYADGDARRGAEPITGDIVFRYGCSPDTSGRND
jgi:hypothetical protein